MYGSGTLETLKMKTVSRHNFNVVLRVIRTVKRTIKLVEGEATYYLKISHSRLRFWVGLRAPSDRIGTPRKESEDATLGGVCRDVFLRVLTEMPGWEDYVRVYCDLQDY